MSIDEKLKAADKKLKNTMDILQGQIDETINRWIIGKTVPSDKLIVDDDVEAGKIGE